MKELLQADFYAYGNDHRIDEAMLVAVQTGRLFACVPERIVGYVDLEDLAEGGVARFLRSAAPALRPLGVTFADVQEEFAPGGEQEHAVTIDGRRHVLWRPGAMDVLGDSVQQLLDEMLAAAGSHERVHATPAEHADVRWVFLTAQLAAILSGCRCFADC